MSFPMSGRYPSEVWRSWHAQLPTLSLYITDHDLEVHQIAFWYHVNELETDYATINVENFDSWLWLLVSKPDWWKMQLTLLLSRYNGFSIIIAGDLKSDFADHDSLPFIKS